MMRYLLSLTIVILTLSWAFSQTGTLRGVIQDELGLGLPGANVYVQGFSIGTSTNVEGEYILYGVPIGTQTIQVSYLGYNSSFQEVDMIAGGLIILNFELAPGVISGTEVLVLGDRLKGQAKALNQQKEGMNITNIVAADQIGRFPDANIGDAMKRIPGITMQGDQGEARNIVVRGLAPQLNSITLNGDRIPSAEGDNRNIQMDLIPSDMIQTIEVNKAVTPNMDADAIGGSVNLVTRPAPSGLRLSATLGSGLNLLTQKPIWNGSFILGNRFANDKLGVIVSGNFNDQHLGSDNIEGEWEYEVESPLTGEDITTDPYMGEMDQRTYFIQRVRRSVQASLDYKFNNQNSIVLRGMYNWRDDWENRYRLTWRKLDPVFEEGTENIIGWTGEARRQTKGGIGNERSDYRRLEDQRVINGSIAGDHLWGNLKADWMVSLSKAQEKRPHERYIRYELGDAIALDTDFGNQEFPYIAASNAADVTNDQWVFDELTEENQDTYEQDLNGRLDFSYPVSLDWGKGNVDFGVRSRIKSKERKNNFFAFSPVSGLQTYSDVSVEDETKEHFLPGDKYKAGYFVTREFLGDLNLDDASAFEKEDLPEEYLPTNYNATEDVYAAYAMWNQKLGKKWSFLLGLRYETTHLEYTGNEIEDGDTFIKEITSASNYSNLLPGAHLRYAATPRTIVRAAWTHTLARPNYYDLVPYRSIVAEDEEIYMGNPDLNPTTSTNFDLMADHYFTTVGILSAGLFYKQIDDFIYGLQLEDEDTGYDLFQPQNGGNADLFGFEISFQRQLDFLPGIWKGLGIYLNYTHIASNAGGIRNSDGELRKDVDLPGTSPQMFNASLSFENKKLVIRTSLNYSDAYIDELGGEAFFDRYYDQQLFLDVNASYAITDQFRIFAEANNLTNQPLRYFQGVSERTMQAEYYNAKINLGLKYDFFGK